MAHLNAAEAALIERMSRRRRAWIGRRTERLSFEREHTVQRRTTCELEVPKQLTKRLPSFLGRSPLPIAGFARFPALHVRARIDGADVPILRREHERSLLSELITDRVLANAKAAKALSQLPVPATGSRADVVRGLVRHALDPALAPAPPPALEVVRSQMFEAVPEALQYIEDYIDTRLIVVLAPSNALQNDDGVLVLEEEHTEAVRFERVAAWRSVVSVIESLLGIRSTYALFKRRKTRRLLIADGSAMRTDAFFNKGALGPYRQQWSGVVRPDSYRAVVPVDQFPEAASYHLELASPKGTYIDTAQLRIVADDKDDDVMDIVIVRDDDNHPDQSHLHFNPNLMGRGRTTRYDTGVLRVVIRPSYHNGLRAGLHVSTMATVVLILLTVSVGWTAIGVEPRLTALAPDTNSIVSLLLLAPTLAIAAVVRQEEDEFVKLIQARYRARLAVIGVALLAAAFSLALGIDELLQALVIAGATCVAAVCWGGTALSAAYSHRRIREKGGKD